VIDPSHPIRGLKWNGKKVLVIYDDPTRGQYYIHSVTQAPIYPVSKPHLAEDQDWHDTGQWICTFPHVDRKAVHEAGHAAFCFLVGIKVEYITIEPHEAEGRRLDGVCQWDRGSSQGEEQSNTTKLLCVRGPRKKPSSCWEVSQPKYDTCGKKDCRRNHSTTTPGLVISRAWRNESHIGRSTLA
jgi:hypothetical protein